MSADATCVRQIQNAMLNLIPPLQRETPILAGCDPEVDKVPIKEVENHSARAGRWQNLLARLMTLTVLTRSAVRYLPRFFVGKAYQAAR